MAVVPEAAVRPVDNVDLSIDDTVGAVGAVVDSIAGMP